MVLPIVLFEGISFKIKKVFLVFGKYKSIIDQKTNLSEMVLLIVLMVLLG